ncbi:dihydrodipicolinate reductase C-terminal domain-containing protein [Amycolatopsis sp. DSM 110486]|uniref:dihydrodipicolinate reductase C-terminal domain-containing protein n=1 Tax=Amycolatopsis sp. DSM 110486 TaxID=2865832 RepID=UPI001C69F2A6|nr:dihydrodipicolinate reductase C-terminal domain-containing protein [Amycolatopsis sp. DSM 110486]QYN17771.1 hypothetical protein K1T34_33910 [Amycolatopsis sp. DSM 110486]
MALDPAGDLTVGIVGVTGRLGSRIASECAAQGIPVVLRATRGGWSQDAVPSVVIDAGTAEALPETTRFCARHGAALVECVSALGQDGPALLDRLAERVAVVRAVNLSVGHWLQRHLVATVARIAGALPATPRAAVLERHTPTKRDRPSASALALAGVWRDGGQPPVDEVVSLRAGHPVSEHTVRLDLEDESLELRHDVRDLRAAAFGAVTAARWAHTAEPGLVPLQHLFDRLFLEETT